ncbi:MAG: PKD domain-containing protein, partial [Bacteroidetes bacterium]
HTADEAGNIGPDYRFGWGLMNTASAVRFINDSNYNRLQERTLNNGQSQSLQFSADAGKPLRITICWTDVSGDPVSANFLDNSTRMLVNDLDIRLVRNSDNTLFNPYILDPANPNAAATTGDNIRDNVEMIHLAAPQAGNYTLTISHKGLLSGSNQKFSLLISNGVEKPLALFNTNRTVLCSGQTVNFTDASTGAITQRTWYFPGGTPSTSTYYPVALKVTGGLGTDSTYKADYINVGGLNLPFNETFESNSPTASSWQIVNPDAANTWQLKTTSGTTPGSLAMSMQFFDYSSVGQRDGLVSPTLNFKSHTNINLTFKHAYTKFGTNDPSDSLVIYASTNCGNSWIRVASFGENGTGTFATFGKNGISTYASDQAFTPTNASEWCSGAVGTAGCKTVSLNQFAGQPSVQLKFEGYTNFSNNLYIDNISVDGTPIKPIAAFEAVKTNACTGEGVQFNDKSEHIPSNWSWTFVGATPATSTSKNPIVTYAQTGSYQVKLKVSNVSGADSIEIANYINIVVPPKAPNIKATGSTEFCLGDSVLLSTDSSGNNIWYANNIVVAQNVSQLYAKQDGIYKVARSNGSCEAFSSINVKAGVKPLPPIINASITGSAFCPGSTVTLSSDAPTGNEWYKNGTIIPAASGVTLTVTDSGSYTVITKPNGCPSNPSLAKSLGLLPRPTVGNITGADQPIRGESTPYTVTAEPNLTYVWTAVNGTILSGNNTANVNARFNVLGVGTISVSSKSAAGCLSLAASKQVNTQPPVGLPQYELIQQLAVYPIPTKTSITLEIDALKAHPADVKIINLLGQVVEHNNLNILSGKQRYQIDLSQLTKGVYFIELNHNENKVIKRIVVE